jgi:DNA-binding transcriptional regulator YdaS (Cro superfamily)
MAVVLPRSGAAVRRAIVAFGDQPAMAVALGVSQSTVSEWATDKRPVPAERCPAIERMTRERGQVVSCEELRPDIEWSVLRENALGWV